MVNIYDDAIECLQEIQIDLQKNIEMNNLPMANQYDFDILKDAIKIIKNYKK